jgi:2,5-furandicarboxylate decarboxylase 1
MSLRKYLHDLESQGKLRRITQPISTDYEIAAVLKKLEPAPVLFENVRESRFKIVGNLCCDKASFAGYFGIQPEGIIPLLSIAIQAGTDQKSANRCNIVETAACQDVIELQPDLNDYPILRHFPGDGGNYITSGVMAACHPRYGQNLDFHRCMKFSADEMAVRVVRGRHFDEFLQELGQVDVAVCVGNAPGVLAAAATSVEIGVDELNIANALEPTPLVRAKTVDVLVPADAEFILEGTVYWDRRHAEGPFVDLTETQDIIRQEPVFVVKAVTHRKDAIWHALLPGGLEHKLLMGMPREPTIFQKVSEVVRCLDVNVSPGGCSWLHAIVQIDKQAEEDGIRAIQATFAGHRSCKHVYVVDRDIDIYDPLAVEWAMATRFQGDRQMVVKEKEPGSSLDPSAEAGTHRTTRVGFDLTKPLSTSGKTFDKVAYPKVDLKRFLNDQ